MASTFPGAIDNFTDPLTNSPLNSPSHAGQHQDLNDAVEKVETYMGLVKVIPTGATNGTVGATGTVTIGNAVTSVTVSGAFSSLYDNYVIIVSNCTPSANSYLRMRLGSKITGYNWQLLFGSYANTALGLGSTTVTNAYFGYLQGFNTNIKFDAIVPVMAPNLAQPTRIGPCQYSDGGAAGFMSGYDGDNTQYTSFELTPQGGTFTGGTIRVYGYRN